MNLQEIVRVADRIQGWMSPQELEWLATQASTRRLIVEVGSRKGRSTKALAMATPGVVLAIDHWLGSEGERQSSHKEAVEAGQAAMMAAFRSNLSAEFASGKVIQMVGDSVDLVPGVRTVSAGRGVPIDMVFIDGDHSYAAVKRDIEAYRPLLAEGGILSGHDYAQSTTEVIQVVNDLLGKPEAVVGSIWSFRMGKPR